MRDIKFRDYEMQLKQMRYFDLDGYDINEHNCYGNIMQFTGLQDKNGKDIYEGDIIKRTISFDKSTPTISKEEVIFEPGFFTTKEIGTKEKGLYLTNFLYHEMEVIGNIHEHPNLLL